MNVKRSGCHSPSFIVCPYGAQILDMILAPTLYIEGMSSVYMCWCWAQTQHWHTALRAPI